VGSHLKEPSRRRRPAAQEGRRQQRDEDPDKEQLKAFLKSVTDDRLSPLWHTIAMTGMRRGEAIGLRWSVVDLEAGCLAVRRALIPNDRDVIVSEPETVKGRRVIAVDPGTVEVSKGQAARQLDEQKEWDEAWVESGLVFTAENGAALNPETVARYYRQAVKSCMLPSIRLHDLTHTHATLALQAASIPRSSPSASDMRPSRSPSTPARTLSRRCKRWRRR
jgi:integrase